MLDQLQANIRELLELVRETTTYTATLAAVATIEPTEKARSLQQNKVQRITDQRQRWDL